ncbi:MAG: plastocyanin/azurin family copper-binding protein [Solirubrobacteraceae bacterium]
MLTRHPRRVIALGLVLLGLLSVSAVAASTKSVKVADNYYGPRSVSVGRGTKVTWRWTGVLKHNVVIHTGPAFFSSKTQVRGTFTHIFTKRGTYALVCTVHPKMKMTLVVR